MKTGNVAAAERLDAMVAAPGADPAATALQLFEQIDATKLGALQTARASTLGWETKARVEPPALTGRLTIERETMMLHTALGDFAVLSDNPVGRYDLSAFRDRLVTVKGWPVDTWKPGVTRSALAVEEFAPGASPEFLTGRVYVDPNGDVFVAARRDKRVKITDPDLKTALSHFAGIGIVLPKDPVLTGDVWTYPHQATDYYVLGGFRGVSNRPQSGEVAKFRMELGHGNHVTCELPIEAWKGTRWRPSPVATPAASSGNTFGSNFSSTRTRSGGTSWYFTVPVSGERVRPSVKHGCGSRATSGLHRRLRGTAAPKRSRAARRSTPTPSWCCTRTQTSTSSLHAAEPVELERGHRRQRRRSRRRRDDPPRKLQGRAEWSSRRKALVPGALDGRQRHGARVGAT